MTARPPLTTVVRALDTLEVLWRLDGAGVTAVAEQLDLPKSTVHEYLNTLEQTGYVVNDGGVYSLSLKLLEVGSRIQYRNRLYHVSRTEIGKLADETGEAANVTVEERGRAVILHSEESVDGLSLGTYPGLATPIHSLAPGKVILAGRPPSFLDEVVDRHGIEAVTDETITDRDALEAELEQVAADGYAVDWDEQVVGMGLVAVPITVDPAGSGPPTPAEDDPDAAEPGAVAGEVLGAATVVCPTARLRDPTQREDLVQAVRNASNVISFNYQYGP